MALRGLEHIWGIPIASRDSRFIHCVVATLYLVHLFTSFPHTFPSYFSLPFIQNDTFGWNMFSWVPEAQLSLVFFVAVVSCLLTLFSRTRILALLYLFVFQTSIARTFQHTGWHVDPLFGLFFLYLIFIPFGKQTRYRAPGLRLLQVQLSLIYLISALTKLRSKEWISGTAVSNFFEAQGISSLILSPFQSLWIGYFILGAELLWAVGIWLPRARTLTFTSALVFHLFVFAFTDIKVFSLLMLTLHVSYLRKPLIGRVRQSIKKLATLKLIPSPERV